MHRSSLERMRAFRDAYLAEAKDMPLRILDVGSAAIAGDPTYRDLFTAWDYVGLDAEAGVNVDIAVRDVPRLSRLFSRILACSLLLTWVVATHTTSTCSI